MYLNSDANSGSISFSTILNRKLKGTSPNVTHICCLRFYLVHVYSYMLTRGFKCWKWYILHSRGILFLNICQKCMWCLPSLYFVRVLHVCSFDLYWCPCTVQAGYVGTHRSLLMRHDMQIGIHLSQTNEPCWAWTWMTHLIINIISFLLLSSYIAVVCAIVVRYRFKLKILIWGIVYKWTFKLYA